MVKDAIEFCDSGVDNRSKQATDVVLMPESVVIPVVEINFPTQVQTIPLEKVIPKVTLDILKNNSNEFVPTFTDLQRKQLDEQLRNVMELNYFFIITSLFRLRLELQQKL